MRRVARLLLLWLIVAVVPLHGSAVAMALRGHAAPGAAGQGTPHADAHMHKHMHMHAHMHAHGDPGMDMPAPMGDPAPTLVQAGSHEPSGATPAVHHDACNACSACCSPAALPDLPTLVAVETVVLARPAGLASPSPVFLTDGPERPPRGVLA